MRSSARPPRKTQARLRDDLIAGPHPEHPDTWLVHCPRTDQRWSVPRVAWEALTLLDGRRSIDALEQHRVQALDPHAGASLGADLNGPPSLHLAEAAFEQGVLREFAERARGWGWFEVVRKRRAHPIEPQWATEPMPEAPDLVIHAEARFECVGAGACCERGYRIPLSPPEAAAVRRAAQRLSGAGLGRMEVDDPVTFLPRGPGQPWATVLDNDRGCPFHDPAAGCLVHRTAAQPAACRVFPLTFVKVGPRVHASVTHRCGCGALGRGPRLHPKRVRQEALRAGIVLALPERVRIDESAMVMSERAAGMMVDAADGPLDPWAMILSVAKALEKEAHIAPAAPAPRAGERRAPTPGGRGTTSEDAQPDGGRSRRPTRPGRALRPEVLFQRIAAAVSSDSGAAHAPSRCDDPALNALLVGTPLPGARKNRLALKAAGLWDPKADPRPEVGRFVRDHLFGLQPFRAPTLAQGIWSLGLAVASALHRLPNRASHPAVRLRIMAWEDQLASEDFLRGVVALGPRTARMSNVLSQLEALARWQ